LIGKRKCPEDSDQAYIEVERDYRKMRYEARIPRVYAAVAIDSTVDSSLEGMSLAGSLKKDELQEIIESPKKPDMNDLLMMLKPKLV